jgi:hypothetical protein
MGGGTAMSEVDAEFLATFDRAWPHEWYTLVDGDQVGVVASVRGEWDVFLGATLRQAMEKMLEVVEEEAEDDE